MCGNLHDMMEHCKMYLTTAFDIMMSNCYAGVHIWKRFHKYCTSEIEAMSALDLTTRNM